MSIHRCFAILFVFLIVIGCSGIEVSQDYDPAADFSDLATYQWASDTQPPTGNVLLDNPLVDRRIRAAVDRILAANGFQPAPGGPTDFRVTYQTMIQQRITSDHVGGSIVIGRGGRGRYGGAGISSTPRIVEYDEGTLVIDIVDATTAELLWRGTGTYRIEPHMTPEETTATINAVVEKILSQFPPPAEQPAQ